MINMITFCTFEAVETVYKNTVKMHIRFKYVICRDTVNIVDGSQSKLTQLSDWFTWCQTCRHGGHADHMTSWFRLVHFIG